MKVLDEQNHLKKCFFRKQKLFMNMSTKHDGFEQNGVSCA